MALFSPLPKESREKSEILIYKMDKLTGGFYQGEKTDNWFHGQGTFTFDSGIVYEGGFH